LRVQTFAGNIKAVPPVSPILILNKLDIDSFCELSNNLTSFLLSNSYINLTILKNRYAGFSIDVKNIPLGDFIK
jgi:ribosomal protein L11